jgi:hypothetical protein
MTQGAGILDAYVDAQTKNMTNAMPLNLTRLGFIIPNIDNSFSCEQNSLSSTRDAVQDPKANL